MFSHTEMQRNATTSACSLLNNPAHWRARAREISITARDRLRCLPLSTALRSADAALLLRFKRRGLRLARASSWLLGRLIHVDLLTVRLYRLLHWLRFLVAHASSPCRRRQRSATLAVPACY